jgi:predicted aspartyl protease
MVQTKCGFDSGPQVAGADLLLLNGPTLLVNIGFDPDYKDPQTTPKPPAAGVSKLPALVDTGATECCIDNLLAATLKLPIVDRRLVAGSAGSHLANVYLAQVHIVTLNYTIYGAFAGVDLAAGGQAHSALIGRTFLRNFTMTYEGRTGTVIISNGRVEDWRGVPKV